jgi:hypothetical protein
MAFVALSVISIKAFSLRPALGLLAGRGLLADRGSAHDDIATGMPT